VCGLWVMGVLVSDSAEHPEQEVDLVEHVGHLAGMLVVGVVRAVPRRVGRRGRACSRPWWVGRRDPPRGSVCLLPGVGFTATGSWAVEGIRAQLGALVA